MKDTDPQQHQFGVHVKRLREVRKLTQEGLAVRSGLASDTVRRLEHGEFSPRVFTLRKLCKGLDLSLAQLFQSFELAGDTDETSELVALVHGRGAQTMSRIIEVIRAFLQAIDDRRRDRDAH